MLGASGALLQAAETAAGGGNGAGAAVATAISSQEGRAQAGAGGGVSSVMAEIGDEDSKGKDGGEGGSDELGAGGDRGFLGGGSGGNRWPRQETLALLKIRSDMDAVFRDSSLKSPLWEEVARKMAELGYQRSAKKCKEKFENVYKYHKRTKEGRAAKANGQTYRFFDQLEAFESTHQHSMLPPPLPPPQAAVPISMAMPSPQPPAPPSSTTITQQQVTVPSTTTNPLPLSNATVSINLPPVQPAMPAIAHQMPPVNFPNSSLGILSSSSSTSSDEEIHGMKRKRKRKWKDCLERLMKELIGKQEELQRKFLEAIEKRKHDQMLREEAWKVQEMARLNREHEILVQERFMAAAKDSALISFLQKLSDQHQIPLPPPLIQPQPRPPSAPSAPAPVPASQTTREDNPNPVTLPAITVPLSNAVAVRPASNGDPNGGYLPPSSLRWPKTEVEALIKLRTSLDQKYQEKAAKGPLWEEISAKMKKLGYNRSAKRCKEKWENINKYFKKVKESNKKRPEDSRTCPYFHQLDELYREKHKLEIHQPAPAAPIMARPEQQWPLPAQQEQDPGSDTMDQDRDDEDDDGDEEDDDDGGFEIVASNNNASSMGGAPAATAALQSS